MANPLKLAAASVPISTDIPCRCGKGTSPAWRPEIHWLKINGRSQIDWCDARGHAPNYRQPYGDN